MIVARYRQGKDRVADEGWRAGLDGRDTRAPRTGATTAPHDGCQTNREAGRVRILRSALKHGCTSEDIAHAIASAWRRTQVGEDPTRWLYVGVDPASRPLEIVSVEGDDGGEVVIHAMKLRKKYRWEGGRR